ncbi:MAG TPA: HEAT repeat domain-containing protein [Methanoregulaceae archaeon]|nr:HEAT repeat domain-containing protein [Methanoregulaceae archaeon]
MKIWNIFRPDKPDIERLKEKRDIHELVWMLRYPDLEIQWQAAAALSTFGKEGVDHLLEALRKTRNKHVKLGIIEALGEIRDNRAVPDLLKALKDNDNEIRWEAALALGEIGDAGSIPALVEGLKDEDRYVRYATAIALERLNWKPENETLHAYLHLGKQEWDKLQGIGYPAIEALAVALKDRNADVREKAVQVLGEIGSPDAIPFVYRALRDASDEVRWSAVKAAPRVGISLMYLPRGLSMRPRIRKNPAIAAFLNFVLPGMGYFYLGKWWGIVVFQIDVYITTLNFASNGELFTYVYTIPIYLALAAHAWYMASKMPDL